MSTTTELTLLDRLIAVAKAYQAGHQITVHQASDQIFNDTRKLGRLYRSNNPDEVGHRLYGKVIRQMSETWPRGAVWPSEVDRPGH